MAGQIRFANKVQVWLWEGEISGQISDGMWENASPSNHYKAFWDVEVGVGAPGMTGVYPRKKYDFSRADLLSVVGDRMLFTAKAAVAYPNIPNDETTIHAFNRVGDHLKNLTQHDFMKAYVKEVEAATGEDIQTVIKKVQAVPYTMSNLRKDLKQMSQIVAGKKVEAPAKEEAPAATSEVPQTLAGVTFCITGEFPETRNVITKKLESMGAAPTSSVSQMTKVLIVGENPGSKLQRARQLGTRTVGIDWLESNFAIAGIPFGKKASVGAVRTAQAKKFALELLESREKQAAGVPLIRILLLTLWLPFIKIVTRDRQKATNIMLKNLV
jgi:BRCA1 C Terminus (BRCT) domain